MNASDKRHLDRISELGCIACRLNGIPGTPAEIHHPRAGVGMGQRASHKEGLALCPAHHRGTDHPMTPSIHLDKARFIYRFGTEAELLEAQQAVLDKFEEIGMEF